MKINGQRIEGPNRDVIVIPRGDSEDIVFTVEAVLDIKPFEKMCPLPKPPLRKMKGGVDVPNFTDPAYKQATQKYAEQRVAWLVLKALEATEGLEWEKVDISDPSTWLSLREELRDSGFSDVEINRIVGGAISVNALSEEKIQAARERFFLSRAGQGNESFSLAAEENITPFGEPVNVSE